MMTTLVIPRGGRAAAEEREKAKANKGSGNFGDYEMLKLAEPEKGERYGESIVIRLVHDEEDWPRTKQHNFVNTKAAPKDLPKERKWPNKMGAVCRHSEGFNQIYDECFLCDHTTEIDEKTGKEKRPYAGLRLWAVAAVREPVLGTEAQYKAGEIEKYQVGKPVDYKDATYEKEIWDENGATGKFETRRKYVILNFGLKNFFDSLLGDINAFDTTLNVDYLITRVGRGTDTTYDIKRLEPVIDPETGKKLDLRNEEMAARYAPPFDLVNDIIAKQASDDHYEWFFDTRVESSWEARFPNSKSKSSESAVEATPATREENDEAQSDAAAEAIAKMRAQMKAKS